MKLLVTLLLLLGAHFALTATVMAPAGQAWLLWPFAADAQAVFGLAGEAMKRLTNSLSVIAGVFFLAALLALFRILIPAEWWGILVGIAAVTSLMLCVLYMNRWTILPMLINVFLLWGLLIPHWSVANLNGP